LFLYWIFYLKQLYLSMLPNPLKNSLLTMTPTNKQRRTITIIGGGIAGLSAAHEFTKRGYTVTVYEKHGTDFGGKAKSVRITSASSADLNGLAGEHGFRFFPRFYRHLQDTMAEIPYQNKTVLDNLVEVDEIIFAAVNYPTFHLPARLRGSLRSIRDRISGELKRVGVQLNDAERHVFATRMWQLMTSCDERRFNEYERLSWWSFMEGDLHSDIYKDFLARGLTRTLVAARAECASVKTGGDIICRLLWEFNFSGDSIDRVLNGPTNEVWINPWREYLRSKGVVFVQNAELVSINCSANGSERHVNNLVFAHKNADGSVTTSEKKPEYVVMTAPVECFAAILEKEKKILTQSILKSWVTLDAMDDTISFLLEKHRIIKDTLLHRPTAIDMLSLLHLWKDVNAIAPVESPEFYTKVIQKMVLTHDPSLEQVLPLSKEVEWMVGLMFYMRKAPKTGNGHIILPDSAWAITAFLQTDHWAAEHQPQHPECKAIFSIDISDWNTPGVYTTQKPARFCTKDEVAAEVWAQLQASFNKNDEFCLDDDDVLGYYIDDAVAYDEKGKPKNENAMPILVNSVNSWHLRPTTQTNIDNLFLAGDYVKTNTDLATMEGANEAAKRAVNAILQREGANKKELCTIHRLQVPLVFRLYRRIDSWYYKRGLPYPQWFSGHIMKGVEWYKKWKYRQKGATNAAKIAVAQQTS
jgi:uncharacterized protein with NAD-binding domain and iron-sulfur cluster